MRRLLLALPILSAALIGCAPTDEAASPGSTTASGASQPAASSTRSGTASETMAPETMTSETAATDACAKESLETRTPGTLTVGTDKPAYEPWFQDNDPTNGKGYESAVAYAVAKELGFAKGDVKWTVVSFNQAISPAPKTFDVDINQVSITAARAKNVDFTSGYYDVAQSVVTVKGSKAENASSLADLKQLKLGAQVGTTSYTAAKDTIAPSQKVAVYNTNDDAKAALQNGQIDALVVDLPTGLFLAAADLKGGKLVGQVPTSGQSEQFGMVLDKGSALTSCVSKAVDALRSDGTLKKLEQRWLTSTAGAPELR